MRIDVYPAPANGEGYCEGCEHCEHRPICTLVIGGFGSPKRVTLCEQCLARLGETVTYALAKYGAKVGEIARAQDVAPSQTLRRRR